MWKAKHRPVKKMSAPMVLGRRACELCGKTRSLKRHFLISRRILQLSCNRLSQLAEQKDLSEWQPVIGLEIHAQIKADSKLYSGSAAKFGATVNSQVAFLDTALPGTLPVLNKRCVDAGVLTASALGCTVNRVSRFDRKHYFYADLPAGYQITQQHHALANGGAFTYILYGQRQDDCVEKTARIIQLQLEQDSGKSLHDQEDKQSLIDLNRAGCGLMEIVTEPDFTSAEEAKAFARDIRLLLMMLGTCDGKMAEGSMRVDANISIHRPGEPLGVRSEVKNINTLNSLRKAIDFEIKRQIQVLESGGKVINETRSFDIDSGETLSMRDKESKQDYRFMPEPNLPPLHLYDSHTAPTDRGPVVLVDKLRESMPKLPAEMREYVIEKYGLSLYDAALIVNEELLGHLEYLVKDRDVVKITKWLIVEFLQHAQRKDLEASECEVPSATIGLLYDLYQSERLSLNNVRKIMEMAFSDPGLDPCKVADTLDLWQINDEKYLTNVCLQIMKEEPASVRKFKRGKERAINKLMGRARKATSDKANPVKLDTLFRRLIMETKDDGEKGDNKG